MSNFQKVEQELSQTTQKYFHSQINLDDEEFYTMNPFIDGVETELRQINPDKEPNLNNSQENLNSSPITNLSFKEKYNPNKIKIKNRDKLKKGNSSSITFIGEKKRKKK